MVWAQLSLVFNNYLGNHFLGGAINHPEWQLFCSCVYVNQKSVSAVHKNTRQYIRRALAGMKQVFYS